MVECGVARMVGCGVARTRSDISQRRAMSSKKKLMGYVLFRISVLSLISLPGSALLFT